MSLIKVLRAQEPELDLTRTYDAIVIGSGAAGGMAAHVLTSKGLKVLLLEAGKKLDIDKELKSMEWPYEHPRRGAMPPDREALDDERVHDSSAALRRRIEVQQSPLEYPELERRGLLQEHRRGREGAPVYGHEVRLGACSRPRRQDEHLGSARAPAVGLRLQGEAP